MSSINIIGRRAGSDGFTAMWNPRRRYVRVEWNSISGCNIYKGDGDDSANSTSSNINGDYIETEGILILVAVF